MKRWSVAFACLLSGILAGNYLLHPVLHGQNPAAPAPVAAVLPKELTSYRDVVKRVLPAVVSIEAKTKVKAARQTVQQPRQPALPDDPRIPQEFRKFFEEFGRSPLEGLQLPEESPRLGFGSGFIVDPKGVVATNNHVVAGAEEVVVQLHDGRKFVTRDVKTDSKTDLAIVRLPLKEGETLPYLEFGDSDLMEIGDRVLAVGAPFGLAGTVTHGIVSAKSRFGLNMNMYEDFLQTDAPINPGNSGGPLVSLDGKVIGLNSAIKSRNGGFQGIGLAVSSNIAKHVVKALLTDGVVRRGYLGVQVRDLAPEVAERLGVPPGSGVVVGEVLDDTPAERGGLKEGDVITSIAGKAIKDGRGLQTIVASLSLKQTVPVEVLRDGKKQSVSVMIEEQPQDMGAVRPQDPQRAPQRDPGAVSVDKLGLSLSDLTEDTAKEFGHRSEVSGAVIARVQPGSIAALAGLSRGMVVMRVDRQPVATATAAREALEKASLDKGILLQVRSPQGGTNYVLLQSGN